MQNLMKKKWFWPVAIVVVLIIIATIGQATGLISTDEGETPQPESPAPSEPSVDVSPEEPSDAPADNEDSTQPPSDTPPPEHREGDEIVGVSDKNISDVIESMRVTDARNDVTGNWRIATIAESIQMEEYAASYYDQYFTDDKEIHGIVNFNYNTTTKISVLMNGILDITVYEYVDGEEHDANLLYSGTVLKQYWVYLDNGDIEEIA